MNTTTTEAKFTGYIETQSTEMLFSILDTLEARGRKMSSVERFTKVSVTEAIEARHNLDDAMDAIYSDDSFKGTYTEALKAAYANQN